MQLMALAGALRRSPMERGFLAAALIVSLALAFWPRPANSLPAMLEGHGGPIKAIAVSADGMEVLTASFDYSIILWDLSGSEARIVHRLIGHDAAVNDAAFVPGSRRAVSVSDDGSLGIWDLEAGSLVTRIQAEAVKVQSVAVANDGGRAASARWDQTVKVYDLASQIEILTLSGHKGNVNAVLFSADGSQIYTAGNDGQIIEWSAATGAQMRPVYRHGWGVNSIALIDAQRLLFGALDGSAGVVDIAEGKVLTQLAASERPILSVKVSRDGAYMAYGDGEGVIEVFDTATGEKIAGGGPVTFGPVWDFDFVPGTNHIYHVGLDDFAVLWRITPRDLAPIQSNFPRRFQLAESDDRGELEFRRKCSACHTLTPDGENRAGPTLYGVFGRKAGAVQGYAYSPALKNSGIVWTEDTITQLFDHGPDVVVPGTKMPIQRLKSVDRRDDLIRFLKKATASLK